MHGLGPASHQALINTWAGSGLGLGQGLLTYSTGLGRKNLRPVAQAKPNLTLRGLGWHNTHRLLHDINNFEKSIWASGWTKVDPKKAQSLAGQKVGPGPHQAYA